MWFVIGGVLLGLLWWAGIEPVAQLHWGWVLLPFVLAAVWWAIADATGMTQRRAQDKMDKRKVARRERDMKALGLDVRQAERVRVLRDPSRRPPPSSPASPPAPAAPAPDRADDVRRDPRP